MILTILGRCGGFPLPGEATSGYLLSCGGKNILVDCGSGVVSNLFRFLPIEDLDLLVLSHLHYDHQADLGVIKYAIGMSRRFGKTIPNLPVYLPATPAALYPAAEEVLDLHVIGEGTANVFPGIDLRFIAGIHPVESYGLSLTHEERTFAYTGDTRMCPAVYDMLVGADLAVMDAGSLERQRNANMVHMTALECGEAAAHAKVKRTILSHIVPANDPAETLREAKEAYELVEIAAPLGIYEI